MSISSGYCDKRNIEADKLDKSSNEVAVNLLDNSDSVSSLKRCTVLNLADRFNQLSTVTHNSVNDV